MEFKTEDGSVIGVFVDTREKVVTVEINGQAVEFQNKAEADKFMKSFRDAVKMVFPAQPSQPKK